MNGLDAIFSCDIVQQTRFQYVVVAIPIVVTLVVGVTLGVVVQKLGAPEVARSLITIGAFLCCVIIGIVYMAGGQGKLTLTEAELEIKPRWRSAITILRPPVAAHLEPWLVRTHAATYFSGPMLVVEGRETTVALAAVDPDAAKRFPGEVGAKWLKPPNFVVEPGDLSTIVERLGVAWPSAD